MCDEPAGYTTFVGPTQGLRALQEVWIDLDAVRYFAAERPDVLSPADVLEMHEVDFPLAVGVARHRPADGRALAGALQAELLVRGPELRVDGVLCEPGYRTRATASSWPAAPASHSLDAVSVRLGHANAPQLHPVQGARVALLDTGDNTSRHDSVVFTSGTPYEAPAVDEYGHGTAISEIIRARRPHADIHAINVLGPDGTGESYQLLLGLMYCLWHPVPFDIVNASLTTQARDSCPSALGSSIAYLLALRTKASAGPGALPAPPTLVAAGGNSPAAALGYPASLPQAVVVQALDHQGVMASYNTAQISTSVHVEVALGGTPEMPLGYVTTSAGVPWPVYGTSFAAAFVTAAMLP